MKKATIIILVLLVVLLGYYFFFLRTAPVTNIPNTNNTTTDLNTFPTGTSAGSETTNPNATVPPKSTTPAPKPAPTPTPASVSVSISNFAFSPSLLKVKTGTKVTWVNNDSVAHTVTSDSGSLLNSPTISPGQSFSFTFNDAGSFSYHCNFHPSMKGSVTVEK